MATTLTLSELKTAILQRADQITASGASSGFIGDSELTSYINQSYFELYDLLISKYGDDYFVASPYSFTTDGTNDSYSLPSDFYKLLGIDLALSASANSYVTLAPFNFSDRNRYSVPNFQSFYGLTNMRYRLRGSKMWFTPLPAAGQTLRLWYVPTLTPLSAAGDTVDGISGWTEYIIVDGVIKCLQKEESDPSVAMAQKQELIKRIEAMAENRDASRPARVSDVQYTDYWFPIGSGGGYGTGSS